MIRISSLCGLDNNKLTPRPQDIRRILRKQVTDVLRQAVRKDADGITYRAKQCIRIFEEGVQYSFWFDIDRGTANNMRKATLQKRKAIADACFRAKCDADHFSNDHPEEAPIQFVLDFSDDVAELEAEDRDDKKKAA